MADYVDHKRMNRAIARAMQRGQNEGKQPGLIGIPGLASFDVLHKPGWVKVRVIRGENQSPVDAKNRAGVSAEVADLNTPIWIGIDEDGDLSIIGTRASATFTPPGSGGGASAFTDLTDVPPSYSGSALKLVAVNSAATALEFVDAPTVSLGDYIEMDENSSAPTTPIAGTRHLFAKDDGWYDQSAYGTTRLASIGELVTDAGDLTFSAETETDWNDDTSPEYTNGALDQLAERVTTLESGSGTDTTITIQGTAGEALSLLDNVYYVTTDSKWYKIDTNAIPLKDSSKRGVVSEADGIVQDEAGSICISGVVSGYTGLTPMGDVWASTTAGGYTQTKPTVTAGGGQVALVKMGHAVSATEVFVYQSRVIYTKRESLANDATLTISHHTDAMARERRVRAFVSTTADGATLTSYSDTNRDSWVALANKTYSSDQCTGGTATASSSGNAGLVPAYAFDNESGSRWGSVTASNEWIEYEFTSAISISNYRLLPFDAVYGLPPSAWTLQYYNGSSWVTADTRTSVTGWSTGVWKEYTLSSIPPTATRWRIYVTANGGGPYIAIGEIEMKSLVDGPTRLAQGFQVSGTSSIEVFDLSLRKVGSPTGTATIRIETDDGGSASGTLLDANATQSFAESSLSGSGGTITVTLPAPVTPAASTQYHIVLSTDRAPNATNYIEWGADASTPGYANGEMKALRAGLSSDQCTGGTATASSEYNATYDAAKAFDNSNSTAWVSTNSGVPAWLQYTFATAKTIAYYALTSRNTSPSQCFKDWQLQAKVDGSWIAAHTITDAPDWGATETRAYTVPLAYEATEWRIYITELQSGSYAALTEIEMMVYETSAWFAESKDACFVVYGSDTVYDEPAVAGRWSGGTRDIAVRNDDGSANGDTNTTFKNVSGSTLDLSCEVELG